MPLVLVANSTTTFTSGGGQQTVTTVASPLSDYVYVFYADITALASAETATLDVYVDLATGLHQTLTKTVTKGTDPPVLVLPPQPAVVGRTIEWRLTPGGWAANRAIPWRVAQL